MVKRVALVSLMGSEHLSEGKRDIYNDTEPLGLLYIAGTAKAKGHDVRVFHPHQQANRTEEDIARNIAAFRPDILGISSMTNTLNRSMALAEKVKQHSPRAELIVGGDHIGTNPADVGRYPAVDVGVCGEGEETFSLLLDHYDEGNPGLEDIDGIAFREDGELRITRPRKRIADRTKLPLPLRDGEILRASKVGALMYPAPSDQTGAASLLFRLGCPFGCTYCSATALYGNRVSGSSPERVVDEMRMLKDAFGINTGFFTDLTFNIDPDAAEELCRKLAEADLGISWYALVRPTSPANKPILKRSTLEAMAKAGATKIGFGIESFEEAAMKDYRRPASLQEDERILRAIDSLGVLSKVFLIMGHPEETREYYDDVIRVLKQLKPDEVRISYLTPFPGTALRNRLNDQDPGLILSRDYDDYTTFRPIVKMKRFAPAELEEERTRILREYYRSEEYARHTEEKQMQNPHLERSFAEFRDTLAEKGVV